MSVTRDSIRFDAAAGQRSEVIRLIRQIQALTREVDDLKRRGKRDSDLAAREGALEQLRWHLAFAARREANGDLGAVA